MAQGLRERKKERTRRSIAEAAQRLFAERGFDAVTVAEVARVADVSEATVFNHFGTKEDLFYSGMEAFEAALVEAVRARPAGEPAPEAFRRFVLEGTERLAAPETADVIARAASIVTRSPALRAREREIVAGSTRALAELLAEEAGAAPDDLEAHAVAGALMGVQRALVDFVRARVLAGASGRELADAARSQGERAFARLEGGLAGFAPGPARET